MLSFGRFMFCVMTDFIIHVPVTCSPRFVRKVRDAKAFVRDAKAFVPCVRLQRTCS